MFFGWWHRFVRKNTKPIPVDKAFLWKRRLSLAYALFAWHAFGIVAYFVFTGKADWAHYYGFKSDEEKNMSPAQSWAKTLQLDNVKVIRVSGFKKVDEYEIIDGEVVSKETSEKLTNEVDKKTQPQLQ